MERAPRPPDGLTVEEMAAWVRDVWDPWRRRAERALHFRALRGRETGRDRQVQEGRAEVVEAIRHHVVDPQDLDEVKLGDLLRDLQGLPDELTLALLDENLSEVDDLDR